MAHGSHLKQPFNSLIMSPPFGVAGFRRMPAKRFYI
jgi:hypothetical protein